MVTAGFAVRSGHDVELVAGAWFDVDLLPGTSIRSGVARPTDRDNIVQDNEIGASNNANFGKTSARHADPDLTGELLRSNLNVVHPDEVVMMLK